MSYRFTTLLNEHFRNTKCLWAVRGPQYATAANAFVTLAVVGWMFQPGSALAQARDLIKLHCKDSHNGSLISVEIDPTIKRVTVKIPGSDVLTYDDGKRQNICQRECGLVGRFLSAGSPELNFVSITDDKITFGPGGGAVSFTIDRETGMMTPSNIILFDSFVCTAASKAF